MRRIVITGGAGFIGSHLTEEMCRAFPDAQVVVLDKMTYAADITHLMPLIQSKRIQLAVGDICDYDLCVGLMDKADLVIHAAAESHVDRSFHSSVLFTQTNALGTHTVMEACRTTGVPRIIHVSTDEVYGEVLDGAAEENNPMNPTNPYSASKAAAEMIVNGYRHSFKLPIIVIRANNVCGIRQFPEKLIPTCIMSLISGRKIPLHGDGSNVRHYLCAEDFATALTVLASHGIINEIYNIGSPEEYSNKDVAQMVCDQFGVKFDNHVTFVNDRPFNDRRYAISWNKISNLGWKASHSLTSKMPSIVSWYRENADSMLTRMAWVQKQDTH